MNLRSKLSISLGLLGVLALSLPSPARADNVSNNSNLTGTGITALSSGCAISTLAATNPSVQCLADIEGAVLRTANKVPQGSLSPTPSPVAHTPEPGMMSLLFSGLLGISLFVGLKRLRRTSPASQA